METQEKPITAVLGASPKADRYSHMAQKKLMEKGYEVIPVNPAYQEILGKACTPTLRDITKPVDTVTVYIGPGHIGPSIPDIVDLAPRRVILNPGTESRELKDALTTAGIPYLEACTLVLLSTGQY